jgi:hypothetical protein
MRGNAEEKGSPPGMTYGSLSDLPDFSGWWTWNKPLSQELLQNPPPMPPEAVAKFRATFLQDLDPERGRFCRPPQFVGFSGGFVDNVEFLFTPGRVTITNEGGLLRRIYTDGRTLPTDFDATNTGTSVGRWEGRTLVVETVGINPAARYPGSFPGAVPIGKNVRITERISLKDKDTLEFDVITVAPDIFTAPDRRKRSYVRVPKQTASEITFCVDFDRSIDPASGKQRFDMTPPADLAPPPPLEPSAP